MLTPLTAKGPFLGHTSNYVDCQRATFRPLVWRESMNFLYYGITYRKRICREKSFRNRIQHLTLHLADYILCYTKCEGTVRGNCSWEPRYFLMQHHQCDNVATCDVACAIDRDVVPVLKHQRQECTIGKNSCFWLLNCTKGNSTKGKKNDTTGNNFSHLHHKKQYTFQWQESLKNCSKIRPLSDFFFHQISRTVTL